MENKTPYPNEALWRRPLSDAERARLPAQPELAVEAQLTDALAKIPDAPISSNFTARVMQAIDLEESRRSRRWNFTWNWPALLPRIAVTAAVVLFAGVTFRHYELASQRSELAKNVALVAGAQPLPSVDALENLDAIQRMSQPAHADDELLALLQ
jgi:negative regulator of sigma E activity